MKKQCQIILASVFTILTLLSIYYTVIFMIQSIQGYPKATSYYEYNLVNIDSEGIGYFNDEYNQEHKLIHIKQDALPLIAGSYPTTLQQMVISEQDQLDHHLQINDVIDGYTIVGITKLNTSEQSRYVMYTTKEGKTLVDPSSDIEKITNQYNHYQEVRDYIVILVQTMKVLVFVSFILIAINLFYIKHLHLKSKKLLLMMMISILISFVALVKLNSMVNDYYGFVKDLQLPCLYMVYGIISLIYFSLFALLKKLKLV